MSSDTPGRPDTVIVVEEPGDARRALALIDETMAPAKDGLLEFEIERLRIATRAKSEGEQSAKVRRKVFLEVLQGYPADVAVGACRQWAVDSPWFPSEHELRALCEELVAERRQMRAALAPLVAQDGQSDELAALYEAVRIQGRRGEHWLDGAQLVDGQLALKSRLHVSRFVEAVQDERGGHVNAMAWLREHGVKTVGVME